MALDDHQLERAFAAIRRFLADERSRLAKLETREEGGWLKLIATATTGVTFTQNYEPEQPVNCADLETIVCYLTSDSRLTISNGCSGEVRANLQQFPNGRLEVQASGTSISEALSKLARKLRGECE